MTPPIWNRAPALLGALVIAAVAAILSTGQLLDAVTSHRDRQTVARMTEKMKTVCIGRFLIDLPQEARLELRGPRIHGFDISSVDERQADFQARLARREAQLRGTPDQFGGNKNLESVKDVKTHNGVVGKIFVHGRKVTEGTRARGAEPERYRDEGVAIEAMVHGQGMSFGLAADDHDPDKIDNLARLLAKLVPNPLGQIPDKPGFCVDRAWFRDPLTAKQREQVMMSARIPSHPDIEFLILMAAGKQPDKPRLLERSAAVDAALSPFARKHVADLRARQRTIGGIGGDEVVTRFAEKDDAAVYTFWWEADGTADNVLIPHLSLTMETGKSGKGPVPSSLSQDAAMTLWDNILSSIRVRPTRSGKAAPEPTPIPAA